MPSDDKPSLLPSCLSLALIAGFFLTLVADRNPIAVAELFTESGKQMLAVKVKDAVMEHCEQRTPLSVTDESDAGERAWKINMGYHQNETLVVDGKEIGKLPHSIFWVLPEQRDYEKTTPLMTEKEAIKTFVAMHEKLVASANAAIQKGFYPDTKIVGRDTSTGYISDIMPVGRKLTGVEAFQVGNGRLGIISQPRMVQHIP